MEQYYTCITCISNNTWPYGSIVCKLCIKLHQHQNYIREYNIKKTEENLCDTCSQKIENNIKQNIKQNLNCNNYKNIDSEYQNIDSEYQNIDREL